MSCIFEKKKGKEFTKGSTGTRHPLPSDRTTTRGTGASSSSGGATIGGALWDFFLLWDCDKGGWDRDRGCSSGTVTSSSSGRSRRRPCGTETSSSSSGTIAVMGCDSETSSSPTCMRFTLGTSSSLSLTCVMPISYFIVFIVICKNRNTAIYPNSLILEREGSTFLKKKEGQRTYQLAWRDWSFEEVMEVTEVKA
jgi:hypothetical protein